MQETEVFCLWKAVTESIQVSLILGSASRWKSTNVSKQGQKKDN